MFWLPCPGPPPDDAVVFPVPVEFDTVAFDAVSVANRYPGSDTVLLLIAAAMSVAESFSRDALNQ